MTTLQSAACAPKLRNRRITGSMPKTAGLVLCLAAGTACLPAHAVIATDPGDYLPAPAGVDLLLLYGQHAERKATYVDGNRAPYAFRLDSDVALGRWVHYTRWQGMPLALQAFLPYGRLSLDAPARQSATGLGDLTVGASLWPVSDPEAGRHLAIAGFVTMPTGSYEAARGGVNLGGNRYVGVVHLAYVQRIAGRMFADLVMEGAAYGRNDDYAGATLSQRPTLEPQLHLRYELSQATRLGVSYFHTAGGRQTLAGQTAQGAIGNDRMLLTAAHALAPGVQLQAQIGTDLHAENGPRERLRLQFRIAKAF